MAPVPRPSRAGPRHRDRDGSGRRALRLVRRHARVPRRTRTVFHCHGGGLVSCPLDDYHFYGALLAEQLEARVVLADYRLAPEHPFPAAHDDCLAAYRGLVRSGGRGPGPARGQR